MATSALPAPVKPTINSVGINLGVIAVGGTPAGMTVGVAGAGNGKTFPNNGGQVRVAVYNKHATVAKLVTGVISTRQRPGGVTPTNPTYSIGAGEMHILAFGFDSEEADGTVTIEFESTDLYACAFL